MAKKPSHSAAFCPELLPNWQDALSDAALRDEAGAAVFARGQSYAASGAVQEPKLSYLEQGARIELRAAVMGTQLYSVDVMVDEDDQAQGDCDCPHGQDGNFCKHQVALALTLRGLLGGDMPMLDPQAKKKVEAAAKRAQTQAGNRESLRAFVQGQSAAVLAERLWVWAEMDRELMADLKAWAAQSRATDDPKALKGVISDLLRSSGFLDWRDTGVYARRAEKILPMLEKALAANPRQARDLCNHALRRLYKASEDADDSTGEIGGVVQGLMDLLVRSLQADPPPATWLDEWFDLMQADPWGLWDENAVVEAAGPAVQARYSQRAAKDWEAWLASHRGEANASAPGQKAPSSKSLRVISTAGTYHYDAERAALRRRYLNDLKRQGGAQAVIDVMRTSIEGANEHSELVAYCESLSKHREAFAFAQAAYKQFPKDGRSEADVLRCFERDGWDKEALAIRRAQLERNPGVEQYRAALTAAERAGRERESYRSELLTWAQANEMQTQAHPRAWGGGARTAAAASERVVSVRVQWLLSELKLDEALALAQPPNRCDPRLLLALARKLQTPRDAEAVQLLLRVFEVEMARASSPYQEALALVRETLGRMTSMQRRSWLTDLRIQYKAKRNFIKELPAS